MAQSEAQFNLDESPLTPADNPVEALEWLVRPGMPASDASVFADATDQPVGGRIYTPQERADARSLILKAFKDAGMAGQPTKTADYREPVLLIANDAYQDDPEELDVLKHGVG
jgi:hypothetical protein